MEQSDISRQAKEAHQQGELTLAEELYRQMLDTDSDDPDANHLLGVIFHQQRDNEKALKYIQRALQMRPNHPASHNNLGKVLLEMCRYEEALESLREAVRLQPDFPEAHNNQGAAYKNLERYEEAEEAYQKAIQLRPDYINACNNLGNLYKVKGEYTDSLKWYGKALELDPDLPISHYNLGCALVHLGRLNEAEAAFLQAVSSAPEMVEPLNALGRLYSFRFQFAQSLDFLQRALELQPESEEVYLSLANTYSNMERFPEAAYFLEKVVAIAPDSVEALNSLGLVYNFLDRMEEAMQKLDRAREMNPENPDIFCNLATVYTARGLFDESSAASRKALQLDPFCGRAYFQLAQVTRGQEADELVSEMIHLLDSEEESPLLEMQLHFGLAKLLEEKGEYSRAFEYLNKGNRQKRTTFNFSLDLQREIVEKTCEVYDENAIRRFSGQGYSSTVPIFIVGMPRSGTTLVEQILASHPGVHGAGEIQLLSDTVNNYLHIKSVREGISPDISLESKDFSEVGKRYIEQLQLHSSDASRITDKMLGNYMHLGLISLILPDAKIIHCMRNPIDTCLSIYKKLFVWGHQYAYNLEELGGFYLLYHQMMQHWNKVLGSRFLDFSYEELVQDQEGKTRELVEFCDLEWSDECIQFNKHNRPVHTASAVQVRQPMTQNAVGRWKKYGRELEPLKSILQPCFDKVPREQYHLHQC